MYYIVAKTIKGSNSRRQRGQVGTSLGLAKTHCNIAER